MSFDKNSEGIKIPGHRGTWYVCEVHDFLGEKIYELEHETYGDEAAHLLVDSNGNIVMDDVWNSIDDLEETLA